MRPMLRYFGGKSRLAPWIASHFPAHNTYVEPFGGAASVLLAKPRAQVEIVNDVDDEIVNVYRMMRDQGDDLERLLRLTPFAESEYATAYEQGEDALERARRTIVKSFMGVGADSIHRRSGYRGYPHNRARKGDTTCAHEWASYADAVPAFVERLRGVEIRNTDALGLIRQWDGQGTLLYVDPPYVRETRSGSGGYRHEYGDEQHCELVDVLSACKSAVVLSGYRCDMYDELLADWQRVDREVRGRTESLWLRNVGMQQQSIFDALGEVA